MFNKNDNNHKRVVVKVGTNLLTSNSSCLDLTAITRLVSEISALHQEGYQITLVSSGACAAGREKTGKVKGLAEIAERQVYASVGQSRLMNIYEKLFKEHKIIVAQALLTKHDLSDRSGYLNARNTLMSLLDLGILCIVNENDVVAIDEIREEKFGDNDNLSAMVANLVDADLLLILSDVSGLYTYDPLRHPNKAKLIPVVEKINSNIQRMAISTHSKAATGGMITKLEAARLATESGISVIIASGSEPDIIKRAVHGEAVGTRFLPVGSRKESRQRWLLSGLCTRGNVKLDKGAVTALKTQKRSLLPAGVKNVHGKFNRGDAVNILDYDGARLGSGLINYSSDDLKQIIGVHSSKIKDILGYDYGAEVIHRNNLVIL